MSSDERPSTSPAVVSLATDSPVKLWLARILMSHAAGTLIGLLGKPGAAPGRLVRCPR